MDVSKFDLTGRTAIVTGGGRGIGKGVCLALAQAGANVAVAGRTLATLESTAQEIQALGRKSLAIPTDVRYRDQVNVMVKRVVEEFGAIDILVNNAGGSDPQHRLPAMDVDEAAWSAVVDLNLKSTFFCCQLAARVMMSQAGGSIINFASATAFGPFTPLIPYAAAKAGIINMTQSFAALLGPHGIRVNAVAPGPTQTEGTHARPLPESMRQAIPLGRRGTPEEIGWVVVFLASDAAAYVSGQTIRADGALLVTDGGYLSRQAQA